MFRLAWLLIALALPAAAKPVVLTTIKPLTLIVAAVAGDLAEVRQLLPAGDSPHHWALTMSDRRLLDSATLLVWIGPDLEAALAAGVALRDPAGVITAVDLPHLQWPQTPDSATARDAHIWLTPANATAIAHAVAARLARAYPAHQARLNANTTAFAARMAVVEGRVRAALRSVQDHKFIVDHDGLGHFVAAFGLHQAGYLRDLADNPVGARELHRLLARTDISCVVAEPGHQPAQLQRIAAKLGAQIAIVDAFATQVAPGADAYGEFLTGIGAGFAQCLGGAAAARAPSTQP